MRNTHPNKTIALTLSLLAALAVGPVLPAAAAPMAAIPSIGSGCEANGVADSVTCHLYATTGTLALPTGAVPTLGFSAASGGPAQVPGPAIVVDAGDTVTITVHNELTVTTALSLPSMPLIPDQTGISAGATKDYVFTASTAGTFVYEAGGPNGPRQTGAGMAGVIVVEPIGGISQADEHLVVVSEIDVDLNNNPTGFDLRRYSPDYQLINGAVASPTTPRLAASPGTSILLRYANLGLKPHSIGLLGLSQHMNALDGAPLPAGGYSVVAESLAPGQTAEATVAVPPTSPALYPLYEAGFLAGPNAFGGTLTFLEVTGTPPTGGTPPQTSGVAVTPSVSTDGEVTVTATITDPDGIGVSGAELFLDATGTAGTGTAGPPWTLTGLSSGNHTVYVHGMDADDGWGPFASATFRVDVTGPSVSGVTAWPNPSSGAVLISISGTASDVASGGSTIATAEYRVDGGAPASMMVTPPSATTASLDAVIPAGLSTGTHTLEMRATDAAGHTGDWSAPHMLTISTDGPTTSEVVVSPSVTDGTQGYNPSIAAVRIDARFQGAAANVAGGEGFIDAVGASGTGFPLTPKDGLYNSLDERGFAYIPLTTVIQLADGVHTIHVHARDASGNWGATVAAALYVDKLAPVVSGAGASPSPTAGAASFTLTATGNDTATNITAAEWFEGADPGAGFGNAMAAADGTFDSPSEGVTATIALNCWSQGLHTLSVRVKDGNNHWSATSSVTVDVNQQPNAIFSDGFESGNLSAWNAVTGGTNLAVTTGSAMDGSYGMAVTLGGNSARYLTSTCPANEASFRAAFRFNPNGTVTGNNLGTGYAIVSGLNASGTSVLRVEYRRLNTGGGTYQVRLAVNRAGGTSTSAWVTISNLPHLIELRWASGASATASLTIDGATPIALSGLDTSANRIETVRLGPSAGLNNQALGTMYFDAFTSWRITP